MKTAEIRSSFLAYFQGRGHLRTPPAPLVPAGDPSLLFTNAGMVPFKQAFLGLEKPPAAACASSQPCLRAGGKHNDLENVGYTRRHHTLFEMLGNFSFGEYFKEGAVELAWAYLVEELRLDPARLLVSVHREDEESAALWRKVAGLDDARILRLGDADNFWTMGDTGPCGPCSEIYFDRGPDVPGGLPGTADEDERWVEIWNLVFMQFMQGQDGARSPLQTPCVDTGMGLERVASILQGVDSNYETDLFRALLGAIGDEGSSGRVVADHLRAVSFLIAEGLAPSNEGRGYVLRRILRRAARHASKLSAAGRGEPLALAPLTGAVADAMGDAYPLLRERAGRVGELVAAEEAQFGEALERGMAAFEKAARRLGQGDTIAGEDAFAFYDTYGFPLDMTLDMARERGLQVDVGGFEACMEQQRQRARQASGFAASGGLPTADLPEAEFLGYDGLDGEGRVLALFGGADGAPVEQLAAGESGWLALDRTPFYAEAGGQVGDQGVLLAAGDGADAGVADEIRHADAAGEVSVAGGGEARDAGAAGEAPAAIRAEVSDCQASGAQRLHRVRVEAGSIGLGAVLRGQVDAGLRAATARNHSATHLLNGALREYLGEGVEQRGSWVGPTGLRFDISHPRKIEPDVLRKLEDRVNALVLANTEATTRVMSMEEARRAGAIALFGEKYGERVRVLEMGAGYSIELCGGTHVRRTGDIGLFLITDESSVSAGVRRIEGVTGEGALQELRRRQAQMDELCGILGVSPVGAAEKLSKMAADLKQVREEFGQLQRRMAQGGASDRRRAEADGATLEMLAVAGLEGKPLRQALGDMERAGGDGPAAWLAVSDNSSSGGGLSFMAASSPALRERLGADAIVRKLVEGVGGKGGGRPEYAAGGGGDPAKLDDAWTLLEEWMRRELSGSG